MLNRKKFSPLSSFFHIVDNLIFEFYILLLRILFIQNAIFMFFESYTTETIMRRIHIFTIIEFTNISCTEATKCTV